MPKITGTLQRAYFDTKKIEHLLKETPLADSLPTDSETANIELLFGNDYYCDIFSCEIPLKQVAPGLNLMNQNWDGSLQDELGVREIKLPLQYLCLPTRLVPSVLTLLLHLMAQNH